MERLVSMISGGGTTMEAVVQAVRSGEIPDTDIAGIIASTHAATGINKAIALGIPQSKIRVLSPREHRDDDGDHDAFAYGAALNGALEELGATVVTQNGWMPHTPASVIGAYPGRIFNQHPGHPVEFGGLGMYGRRVHAALLEFQKRVGRVFPAMVVAQYADERIDAGSVVACGEVPVFEDDTVETLQARALPYEHGAQIRLLQDFARGHLQTIDLPSFVQTSELGILAEAKQEAARRYPRG